MTPFAPSDPDIARTISVLGGSSVFKKPVRTMLDAHDLLSKGLPASVLIYLEKDVGFLVTSKGALEKAVGISVRTLQRRKQDHGHGVLSVEQSSRAWKFAEILGRAKEVFGSKKKAEDWLSHPAIGLDQRKPIDLLATHVGIEAVENYLSRIEFGVYT
jgi:putative toxin-antitoxin system antitoxin component (TIGR02293 family)